jgi:RHS repeat-associated protein
VQHDGGTDTFSYDNAGNMTSRVEAGTTWTQDFDEEGRLDGISDGSDTWGFVYDGDGVRVKQENPDGTTTLFLGGGSYEVLVDGETTTVKKYYAAGGQSVMRDGDGLHYLLTDHLGSVVGVLDGNGSLETDERYLPFGGLRDTSDITETDFAFTGQRNLSDVGLMDYNARWYSPSIGRFISPDTIIPEPGNPQAMNRYAYVSNNPIRHIDPSGHFGILGAIVGGIVGGVVGAIASAAPQIINNIRNGEPLTTNIDPVEVRNAAVAGAVAGAVGGATFGIGTAVMGTGFVATVASGSISGAVAGQAARGASNIIHGRNLTEGMGNPVDIAIDATIGGVFSAAGYGLVRVIQNFNGESLARTLSKGNTPSNSINSPQLLIDDIVSNELTNVSLTHTPYYNPNIPLIEGELPYGEAIRGTATEISIRAIRAGRAETLITIIHEEMHHRLWARGWMQSEYYVEAVAQRFASMIGVR